MEATPVVDLLPLSLPMATQPVLAQPASTVLPQQSLSALVPQLSVIPEDFSQLLQQVQMNGNNGERADQSLDKQPAEAPLELDGLPQIQVIAQPKPVQTEQPVDTAQKPVAEKLTTDLPSLQLVSVKDTALETPQKVVQEKPERVVPELPLKAGEFNLLQEQVRRREAAIPSSNLTMPEQNNPQNEAALREVRLPAEWRLSPDLQPQARAEQPVKIETSLFSSQSQQHLNAQVQPLSSPAAQDFRLAPASQGQPVENQPSMTMRLKEFQDFPNAMSERVAWMVNRDQKIAQIRLDPPELGKLELVLNIEGDRVSVQFHASGNAVKDLILQQAERLRMAMAGHDLNLVDVNVSTGGENKDQKASSLFQGTASVSTSEVDESKDESGGSMTRSVMSMGSGLLDTFA